MGGTSSQDTRKVSEIVSQNKIVVFQSAGCPYCDEAISSLTASGYTPTVIEASSEQRNEIRQLTNVSSVPSIWLGGKFVGGCNDGPESWMGIKKIIREKKVDSFFK
jgi:glutaredoxin 3